MQKIIFDDNYGLTDAVLQGRKIMTRRIAYDGEIEDLNIDYIIEGVDAWRLVLCDGILIVAKSKYRIGEVVDVAQSYKSIHEEMMNGDYGNSRYDAFRCAMVAGTKGWNNKMFVRADLMPHQIRITDIKAERMQDISDEDCLKEGVVYDSRHWVNGFKVENLWNKIDRQSHFRSAQVAFANLINRISGKWTWKRNPYVFVYTFELVK